VHNEKIEQYRASGYDSSRSLDSDDSVVSSLESDDSATSFPSFRVFNWDTDGEASNSGEDNSCPVCPKGARWGIRGKKKGKERKQDFRIMGISGLFSMICLYRHAFRAQ
jgi:hypothetical protein